MNPQTIHLGLKAGVPLTPYFEAARNEATEYSAATRRYTIGPSVELRSRTGLGLEFDVLFKRTGYVAISSTRAVDSKGDSWDFPLVAKYRLRRGPFVAAGALLRHIGPIHANGDLPELGKRTYPGVTAAAGIEVEAGRLRLLPELRIVRWTSNIRVPGDALRFAPTQAELLLGLLF